jgi:uncharacterized LabA/DUF88 family protein
MRWRDEHLYEMLDWIPGVAVRKGDLVSTREGWRQKGVDVLLAVDLVRLAARQAFDVAVLVAADNDFVPAVDAVLEMGPQVEVVTACQKMSSLRLARKADRWVHLAAGDLLRCARDDAPRALPGAEGPAVRSGP